MKTVLTTLFLLILSLPLLANDIDQEENTLKQYYIYLGGGLSSIDYSEKSVFDSDEYDEDSISYNLDLAFYIPQDNNFLIGGTLFMDGESISVSEGPAEASFRVNTYVLGLSGIYFLNQINNGLFLRGDLGVAKAYASAEASYYGETESKSDSSDLGYGLRAGIGYALPVNEAVSLVLFGGYSIKSVEDVDMKTLSASIGLMF